jgi:hypothetical protein
MGGRDVRGALDRVRGGIAGRERARMVEVAGGLVEGDHALSSGEEIGLSGSVTRRLDAVVVHRPHDFEAVAVVDHSYPFLAISLAARISSFAHSWAVTSTARGLRV